MEDEKGRIVPKNPKRITSLDLVRKSQLQKENEKLLKLIRSFKD